MVRLYLVLCFLCLTTASQTIHLCSFSVPDTIDRIYRRTNRSSDKLATGKSASSLRSPSQSPPHSPPHSPSQSPSQSLSQSPSHSPFHTPPHQPGAHSQQARNGNQSKGLKRSRSGDRMPPPPPRLPLERSSQLYRPLPNNAEQSQSPSYQSSPIFPFHIAANKAGAIVTGPALITHTDVANIKHERFIGTGDQATVQSQSDVEPEIRGKLLGHLPNNAAQQSPINHPLKVYASGRNALAGVQAPHGGSGSIVLEAGERIETVYVPGGETIVRSVSASNNGDARVMATVARPGTAVAQANFKPVGDEKVEH